MERKPVKEPFQSRSDQIFLQLEEAILNGQMRPGELYTEIHLSEFLKVSRTPIREALKRLVQEGLIEETGKGALILGISQQDLDDIYEVRCRIEGLATARYAAVITEEQLRALTETVALQEFYTNQGQADDIKKFDNQFHQQIYRNCGSRVLCTLLLDLHHKVQRFRRASVTDPDRALRAVTEHRRILEALRTHDADLASRLAIEHIQNARASIRSKTTE